MSGALNVINSEEQTSLKAGGTPAWSASTPKTNRGIGETERLFGRECAEGMPKIQMGFATKTRLGLFASTARQCIGTMKRSLLKGRVALFAEQITPTRVLSISQSITTTLVALHAKRRATSAVAVYCAQIAITLWSASNLFLTGPNVPVRTFRGMHV
jgi:hypothetical protein